MSFRQQSLSRYAIWLLSLPFHFFHTPSTSFISPHLTMLGMHGPRVTCSGTPLTYIRVSCSAPVLDHPRLMQYKLHNRNLASHEATAAGAASCCHSTPLVAAKTLKLLGSLHDSLLRQALRAHLEQGTAVIQLLRVEFLVECLHRERLSNFTHNPEGWLDF